MNARQLKAWLFVVSLAVLAFVVSFYFRKQHENKIAAEAVMQKAAKDAARQKADRDAAERLAAEKVAADAAAQKAAAEASAQRAADEAAAQKATAEAEALRAAKEAAAEKAAAEAAAQKAAADAAEQKANFLARYRNADFSKKPNINAIAVSAVAETGNFEPIIQSALARRFKNDTTQTVSPFFSPAFVSDGLFENAFNGSVELFSKLELAKSLDALLLARMKVEYVTNSGDSTGTVTANAELEITLQPLVSTIQSDAWTFTANGIDFKPTGARKLAVERLVTQIAESTNMSLVIDRPQ